MIEHSVVLVLGAGASKPYDFPLGRELRDRAISSDRRTKEALAGFEYPNTHVEEFMSALRRSGCTSVDEFVEDRSKFLKIGKEIMAFHISRCENRSNLDHDWYKYLARIMMSDGFDSFSKNTLSVITYNYDRSLEYYLFNVLQNRFDKNDRECADMLKKIPIIHLHGQLGDLPELNVEGHGVHYRTKADIPHLRLAAEGIHVVNEPIDNNPVFQQAHEVLAAAEYVVFLGFGYLPENVARLQLDECCNANTVLIGTAFDITTSEQGFVKQLFPRPKTPGMGRIELYDLTVYQFLRNKVEILRRR